ncbi:MAG: tRNA (guanosine(46)-N(7))-methyltransferase TrmB [Lactobacillaceae bacterium]|jgi:tRNA (guanine-N7-)-methyltransferase|nr:tRNA (guanosine(46)-N(7))-methyltransferase TrmB [Lactobacillaceae bacterium]
MLQNDKPKFFGRRQGRRIRKAKTTLLDAFLPVVKLDTEKSFDRLFPDKYEKTYLEIGFGNGEHLAGQSLKNQDAAFIGAEVFKNGVANLLSIITGIKEGSDLPETISLTDNRVDNIRVFDDDMRILFKYIPDNSIDKVFVLFPDPWPKKRHADRRFINPDNLKEIHRILKKDGILRIATDHKVYKSWALRKTIESGIFEWTAKCSNDWRREPSDWVQTKYQRKAIREGRKPVFLDFRKI